MPITGVPLIILVGVAAAYFVGRPIVQKVAAAEHKIVAKLHRHHPKTTTPPKDKP